MIHHSLNPPTRDVRLLSRSFIRSLLKISLIALAALFSIPTMYAQISFDFSTLNFQGQGSISASTSLQFGPDGKLYVSERYGNVKVFTIQRNGPSDYKVTSSETITLVKSAQNHDDDGSVSGNGNRQVTGLTVIGTASNPIVYVTSSDPRVGGGGSGGDKNLDTNSGLITRLTKSGNSWTAVDIVRGLPRSEENHATNGLEYRVINGTKYLIVCSGGFTNAGSPSNNFAHISEYALSGAILSVNLTQIEAMSIKTDGNSGRKYLYDIPTLDDPTRPNQNGITDPDTPGYNGKDIGDPFGGNDGLNMGMVVQNGPVQIFSPGYRNSYDLVITESGAVYATDNGANNGWGGYPKNEGGGNATNDYRNGEPGSTGSDGNEAKVNNKDHLHLITNNINNYNFGSYYGGHPAPVRANTNAGLYTKGSHTSGGQFFRTVPYDPSAGGDKGNPNKALPANWPPVPSSMTQGFNGDYRNPGDNNPDGQNDNPVTTWNNNTNGIDEYTASNFGGAMQGNLIAGKNGGSLHRVVLNNNGSLQSLEQNKFSTQGGNALGITCQGDNDVFPGSIWVGTFDGRIVVLEPADAVSCLQPGQSGYNANADYDGDGFSNQDEIDNGTDHCSGASQPNDFDNDSVSDLNDQDDDGDGINDNNDPFQMGSPFDFPVVNELFSDNLTLGGYLGLGLTGLMNNGDPNPNYLDWLDDPNDPNSPINDVLGGAIGAVTIYQTDGDAFNDDQEKAYQYGVKVDQGTGKFVVKSLMLPPYNNHTGNESQGIFLGTGFQNNYIKLVHGANGLKVQGENGGSTLTGLPAGAIPTPTSELILILAVDPAAGTIQAKYSVNGGAVTDLGTPFNVNGAVKTAIQQSNTPLAVGLIGTNGGNGEFAANWDYLNVEADSDNPYITQNLPDLTKALGAPSETINLNQYFDDNGGHGNLTYSVQQNTNSAVGASINGNNLNLSYPFSPASTNITIRATDQSNLFVEQSFSVNVLDQPTGVLYRVNSGGPAISAIDGGLNWSEDSKTNNSAYLSNPGSNGTNGFSMQSYDASVDQSTTPISIFTTERWDNPSGSEMEYAFPIQQPGDYEVRLYAGNGFNGTQAPGSRVFSLEVEGSVPTIYQNIDLSDQFGHQVGAMISYIVNVNDGTLNLKFIHGVENPLVNAIEIIGGNGGNNSNPIVLNNISNQASLEGDNVNLPVQASGGDGNLNYFASGLPAGLNINPFTGVINGTLGSNSADNSPYSVTVSVDDSDTDNTDVQTTSFTWTVTEPGTGPTNGVLYRVNAGGLQVNSIDAPNPNWELDNVKNVTTQYHNPLRTSNHTVPNRDGSVPAYVPQDIFQTERWDHSTGDEMKWFFDVSSAGTYEVRLFFANGYAGTSQPGQRVFNVAIEGSAVLSNYDIVADVGHKVGTMKTFNVNVTDGTLNIEMTRITGDPIINGVEIRGAGGGTGGTPIVLSPISNKTNTEGDNANITVTASGGDGNLVYSASNLPAGVSIDPTNGLIGGTIANGASNNSPYTVGISVDDSDTDNTDVQTTSFVWTINPTNQSNPIVLTPLSNQSSQEGNSVSLAVQATGGDGALVYSASGLPAGLNINTSTGLISGTVATGASNNSPYNVSISVDDSDADNADIQNANFSWTVTAPGTGPTNGVLYRVNAGGLEVNSIDAPNPGWEIDDLKNVITQYHNESRTSNHTVPNRDASVPAYVPQEIFQTERWDHSSGNEMKWFFDVSTAGTYEVRLYFANGYAGTSQVGKRVFNVAIEGSPVLSNYDIVADVGHKVGTMKSFNVTVTDGILNIDFTRIANDPIVNGIEIIGAGGGPGGNQNPTALISATPTSGNAPLPVSFDGSASFDPDNDPLTYSWNFGDGSQGSGVTTSHTYANAGTYTAILTVNDGNGGTAQASQNISVLGGGNPCNNGTLTYLSDLNWSSANNQSSPPKLDKSHSNGTLTINGQTYTKGIGAHANSEIVYNLNGQYERFLSDVGIDDATCTKGSVIFRVIGDGNILFESPILRQADNAMSIDVDVTGVNQLAIISDKSEKNHYCDHANWGGARLENNCNSARTGESVFSPAFTLYPNPTQTGRFIIESDIQNLEGQIEVEIWSMNGQLIKQQNFETTAIKMDIGSDRPEGVYLVKVRYNDYINTHRVLKMN